jgi:hypothetical protein
MDTYMHTHRDSSHLQVKHALLLQSKHLRRPVLRRHAPHGRHAATAVESMYVFMCVCIYVCVCVYIYTCVLTYTCMYIHNTVQLAL